MGEVGFLTLGGDEDLIPGSAILLFFFCLKGSDPGHSGSGPPVTT